MKKILIPATLLMLLATGVTLWSTKGSPPVSTADGVKETEQAPPAIGGAFSLTDQHGKPVRDVDFRGRLMLVFFGFTRCPDICPVTTKSLSEMMALLGDKADQVAPIFITVDPMRDTPEVMKDFLANFDPRIVGLTGDEAEIRGVASAYKAYYAKTQPEDEEVQEQVEAEAEADRAEHEGHDNHAGHETADDDDYLVDHSGYIYLMDRNGAYVSHFQYDASPESLVDALKPHLK